MSNSGTKPLRDQKTNPAFTCQPGQNWPTLFFLIKLCLFIYFYFFIFCCTRGTLWHLQKFLEYIIVEFTPPSFSFISPTPFLEWFQQISLFHLHTCIHNICTIFTLLHPFFISSPFPLVPNPQTEPVYILVLHFWKKENKGIFICLR
jgi:hypothetical protein